MHNEIGKPGDFAADLAVVIGIDAYDDKIGRLATPVRDAEAVARLLASRFGYEVILLCDGTATLAGLRTLLDDLQKRVQAESRLLFYYAGHGVALPNAELEGPKGYLVPHGATSKVESHLPMYELHASLKRLSCRHLLVILDCCFSGSFRWAGQRPLYLPEELLYEECYRKWVRQPAHWALASAAYDEHALDPPDRRRGQMDDHSPFASALLAGLAGEADHGPGGGDGVVTLAELYAYVLNRLVPHQTPLMTPLPGPTKAPFVFRDLHRVRPLLSAEQVVILKEEENPYRGLNSYGVEQADLFFGRGKATSLLLRHVRRHGLTVVVGPSGCGKSSLVQAGLLPRLRARHRQRRGRMVGWIVPPPLRVATDPFAALAEILAAAGGPPSPSPEELRDQPEAVKAWAVSWQMSHPCERLLIVVDQVEELITSAPLERTAKPGQLSAASVGFLACLGTLLEAGAGRLRALIAVRSDYEPDLDEGPLAPHWSAGRFVVPLLSREELREVIEGPAGRKALYFEDPALVDGLIDEAVGMPGGLPLLSYALSRLYLAYLRNRRRDRLLTAEDLATIGSGGSGAPGGIVRILREEADRAVSELPEPTQKTFWRILLRMVNLTGTRPTRRQVPLSELDYFRSGENDRVAEVRRRFVEEERLLVSDRGGIEPAHDELLISWPELARRIDAARERIPIHRRLTETAAAWDVLPAPPRRGLDLRLLGLVEGSFLPVEWLNRAEMEYLAAARDERRSRARLQWRLVALAFLLTVGVAIFLFVQNQRNIKLRYRSTIQSLINQAGADLDSGHTARGMILARQAYNFLPRSEGSLAGRVDQLFHRILDDLPPSRVVLRGRDTPWPVAFDPTGQLLVANSAGRLVEMTLPQGEIEPAGSPRRVPGQPEKPVEAVAVSPDGRWLAAGFGGGTLCVWPLAGSPPRPLSQGLSCATQTQPGRFSTLAFRPGAPLVVAGRKEERSGSIQVWRLTSRSPGAATELWLESDRPVSGPVLSLAVSAAGDFFVSLESGYLLRGSIDAPAASLRPVEAPAGQLVSPLFISERHLVGVAVAPGQILRWSMSAGGGPIPLERAANIEVLGMDRSGRFLTVENEGTHRWLSRLNGKTGVLDAHFLSLCDHPAAALAADSSGNKVAVACDGALRLWNLQPGRGGWEKRIGLEHLALSGAPKVLAAYPGSPALPTVGFANGDVERQNPKTGERLRFPRPSVKRPLPPGASALIWSPDGQTLHVFGEDGLWRMHDGSGKVRGRWLRGPVCLAVGSADGDWLAILVKEDRRKAFLEIWPTSGAGRPVVQQMRSDLASCQAALAFHPTQNELAFGIRNELAVWKLSGKSVWQPRQIATANGNILAVAWSKEFLALGGRGFAGEGIVELQGIDGRLRHRWTIAGSPVNGLAFDLDGRHLVATTTGVGLRVWKLQAPDALPIILDHRARLTSFPVFLTPSRIAALADGGLMIWNLGTKALADAACTTTASNLPWDDWTAYVDADLDQYELTCADAKNGLGIHPSVLAYADSLAWMENMEYAERVYSRINKLEPKTVVDPVRRARAQRMLSDVSRFNATDRQGILDGLKRAEAYDELRGAEHLPSIPPQPMLRLCRRGALLGEAERALPFCDQGLELHRRYNRAAPDRLGIEKALHDGRGLARALLGDLRGARKDFLRSRDWLDDPAWRARRKVWIDALGAGRNPITSEVLQDIAREEMSADMPQPHSPGLQVRTHVR